MNKKTIAILGIGILLSPLFPTSGLNVTITKICERIFFNLELSPLLGAAFSAIIGLSVAVIVFNRVCDVYSKYDYENPSEIMSAFRTSTLIFIAPGLIWFLIPFADRSFGLTYNENLRVGYDFINSNMTYEFFINAPSWIIGTIIGLYIIFNAVKNVANNCSCCTTPPKK
ncbi:MAG: hypothetical protein ABJG41_00095 [Cyclobacteriaceae bacterium]